MAHRAEGHLPRHSHCPTHRRRCHGLGRCMAGKPARLGTGGGRTATLLCPQWTNGQGTRARWERAQEPLALALTLALELELVRLAQTPHATTRAFNPRAVATRGAMRPGWMSRRHKEGRTRPRRRPNGGVGRPPDLAPVASGFANGDAAAARASRGTRPKAARWATTRPAAATPAPAAAVSGGGRPTRRKRRRRSPTTRP